MEVRISIVWKEGRKDYYSMREGRINYRMEGRKEILVWK